MNPRVAPLSPLRKVIAARMSAATSSIPHFRVVTEVEVDRLVAARASLNAAGSTPKISLTDILVKAVGLTLIECPNVNIQWAETAIHHYEEADISVIVSFEGGLSMPIIRAADHKRLRDLANELRELAGRAANGRLRMDEIAGGTFSISNLGMYDVDQFDAIINPPQCAILAVGRVSRTVRPAGENAVRVASTMRLTLSVDHRAIDGATAGEFLTKLRLRLEDPDWLLAVEDDCDGAA